MKEREKLIDQDNLKKDESVGTFRWNDSIKLLNIPGIDFKCEHIYRIQTGVQVTSQVIEVRVAGVPWREV